MQRYSPPWSHGWTAMSVGLWTWWMNSVSKRRQLFFSVQTTARPVAGVVFSTVAAPCVKKRAAFMKAVYGTRITDNELVVPDHLRIDNNSFGYRYQCRSTLTSDGPS
jgi:hypothetical protein